MRFLIRVSLTAALFFYTAAYFHAEGAVQASGEYRHDSFEYEAPPKDFFRAGIAGDAGQGCVYGASYMQSLDGEDRRYTWHFRALSSDGSRWVIAGNYYAHFGSGLLMGRKRIYSPDPFDERSTISRGRSFVPCRGADQRYSFHGLAAGLSVGNGAHSLSLSPFISVRYRFAHRDSAFSGIGGSSLSTVAGSVLCSRNYTAPVLIIDGGLLASLSAGDIFELQCIFFRTGMFYHGDSAFLWDMNLKPHPLGAVRSLASAGVFASVHRGPLRLFIECAFPARIQDSLDGRRRTIRGFGAQFGGSVTIKRFRFYYRMRENDRDFYAPYGTGSPSPMRRWEGGVLARLSRYLEVRTAGSRERRLLALSGDDSVVSTERQTVLAKILFPGKGAFSLQGRRIVKTGDRRELLIQLRAAASFRPVSWADISFNARAQRKGREIPAGSFGCRAGLRVTGHLGMSFGYTRALASTGQRIYVNETSWMRTPTSGTSIDSNSHLIIASLRWISGRSSLVLQYRHRFSGGRSVNWRAEAYCRLGL